MTTLDNLKTKLDTMLDGANAIEAALVALVAKVAPWAAPLPTAWLVWDRTVSHFGWPWQIGAVTALVVESLGLVTTLTALELWSYNRGRPRKTDPPAPLALPWGLVGAYFLSAELLTAGLDVIPKIGNLSLVDWVPALFPVLSLVGMALIAVRVDHVQRLAGVAAGVKERQAARQAGRQAAVKADEPPVALDDKGGEGLDKAGALDRLLDIYRTAPSTPVVQAAEQVNRSRQTVYTYLDEMERAGRVRRNGHGVEVLEKEVV